MKSRPTRPSRRLSLARLLESLQRRFQRARPGSVLIMVVSLLVLLALIGTAAMSTARVDRQSAVQNSHNVQVDMLVEGLKNMVLAQVVDDLFAPPWGSQTDSPGTDPFDDQTDFHDVMYGSRTPEPFQKSGGNYDYSTIVWRNISFPPVKSGVKDGPWHFDPPNVDSSGSNYDLRLAKVPMRPTAININGALYPALQPINPSTGAAIGSGDKDKNSGLPYAAGLTAPFLAADASGSGIPDSILFRLPVSPIQGVTWYGAVRVIDNNSALNVNTAGEGNWAWNTTSVFVSPPAGQGTPAPLSITGWFPASTALYWQGDTSGRPNVIDPAEVGFWNAQRFLGNYKGSGAPVSTSTMVSTVVSNDPLNPLTAIPRSDFIFISAGDALWHQLGRRLDNPGWYTVTAPLQRYGNGSRPFSIADSIALARRYVIADPTSHDSIIEGTFFNSTYNLAPQSAYTPVVLAGTPAWFTKNFDYEGNSILNARPLLTAYNPVRNKVRRHLPDGAHNFSPRITIDLSTGLNTSKTNINTAPFEELLQSFYDTMCDADNPNFTPFDDDAGAATIDPYRGNRFTPIAPFASIPEEHPSRMFRSPIRGNAPTDRLAPFQTMILRAAIAAANVESLRGLDTDLPLRRTVTLPAVPLPGGGASKAYTVDIYGLKRQPFITEVYLNSNVNPLPPPDPANPPPPNATPEQNPKGFVEIELHNPYDVAIPLDKFHVKVISRGTWPNLQVLPLIADVDADFPQAGSPRTVAPTTPISIPAKGFIVLHNFKDASSDDNARYVPKGAAPMDKPAIVGNPTKYVYIKGLDAVFNKEVIITRDGDGGDIPLDSFDATGIELKAAPTTDKPDPVGPVEAWHYSRSNNPTTGRAWHFVYPGRYDGSLAKGRQQGTLTATWDPKTDPQAVEPWIATPPNPPVNLGTFDNFNSREDGGNTTVNSTFAIQLFASASPRFTVAGKPVFPFGGFPRAGDVMRAPFIGSYKIRDAAGNFVEINPVTLDSAFAEDTDVTDDVDPVTRLPMEDIGRFAPLKAEMYFKSVYGVAGVAASTNQINDSARREPNGWFDGYDVIVTMPDGTRQFRKVASYTTGKLALDTPFTPAVPPGAAYRLEKKRYGWCKNILDYFATINAPADDYLPSTNPKAYSPTPQDVKNTNEVFRNVNRRGLTDVPPSSTEDDVCTEGLINLNTANWKVLSSLPLVLKNDGYVDRKQTEALAKAIVYFRDVDSTATNSGIPWGPFKSILELNAVPGFDTAMGAIIFDNNLANDPKTMAGDISPIGTSAGVTGDQVRCDFEERYLNLTRISNLVTLRSDTFTAYIIVQGWSNAGTANAKLVAQRRMAFIADRSKLTPTQKSPASFTIPMP